MGTRVKQTTDRKEMRISSRVETKRNIRAPTQKKKKKEKSLASRDRNRVLLTISFKFQRNVGKWRDIWFSQTDQFYFSWIFRFSTRTFINSVDFCSLSLFIPSVKNYRVIKCIV